MIVIKIELWPGGDQSCARTIAEASVYNDSGLADISDYRAHVMEHASDVTGLPDQCEMFDVRRHRRRSSVWALVAKVAFHAARSFTREDAR